MWLESHDNVSPSLLYTDSLVAISWISHPTCPGSRTTLKKIGDQLLAELHECDEWIKKVSARREMLKRVRHWNTLMWGEIPADYNRK